MSPRSDVLLTVWSFVVSGSDRSSRWLCRMSAVGSAFVCPVSTTHLVQPEVLSHRPLLSSLFSRAWSLALLFDFFVCSFVRFPYVLPVWSVAPSVRLLISVVSFLVASGSRSLPASLRLITMADNVDEVTPVSPSAPMPGVTTAIASSVEPVSASVDPTMAALFDTVRARSSASVTPPRGPASTPSGYVNFTGTVRRSIGMDTHDPEGVIGAPAETSDRLLASILKRPGWAE